MPPTTVRPGLAALLALAATLPAGAQTERQTLSGSSVAIYDLVGAVTVERGTGSDVVVEVSRRGADAKQLKVNVSKSDGRDVLRIEFPDDDIVYPEMGRNSNFDWSYSGWSGGWRRDGFDWSDLWGRRRVRIHSSGRGTEAWADLKVIVPAGKRVDVNVLVGSLAARGTAGDLRLHGGASHVTVDGHDGLLRVETGSGGADVSNVKGDDAQLEAGSGRVRLRDLSSKRVHIETGSGGVDGDRVTASELRVEVGSGGVRLDRATADDITLETGSGGLDVEVLNSPKRLTAHAGSGSTTLTLPANLDAEFDVHTGSGGITSDFPIQMNRYERRTVRGTVGKGTGTIRIETGSGGVRLRSGR